MTARCLKPRLTRSVSSGHGRDDPRNYVMLPRCYRTHKMQGMPKRPRSHQLEDLSERAIRSVLPSRWVVRADRPDYGIDLSIEIVDESETLTGRRFFVQLKGTDEQLLKKALAIRL